MELYELGTYRLVLLVNWNVLVMLHMLILVSLYNIVDDIPDLLKYPQFLNILLHPTTTNSPSNNPNNPNQQPIILSPFLISLLIRHIKIIK